MTTNQVEWNTNPCEVNIILIYSYLNQNADKAMKATWGAVSNKIYNTSKNTSSLDALNTNLPKKVKHLIGIGQGF